MLFIVGAFGQEWTEHYKAFDKKEFKKLDGWAVTGSASLNYFYTCGGQMIVGGPLAFGKGASLAKTFKLPPHY